MKVHEFSPRRATISGRDSASSNSDSRFTDVSLFSGVAYSMMFAPPGASIASSELEILEVSLVKLKRSFSAMLPIDSLSRLPPCR